MNVITATDDSWLLSASLEQILDESTLHERIVAETEIGHPEHPGRKARKITVRFFSHEFKGAPLWAKVNVYVPLAIPDKNKGLVAVCPAGTLNRLLMPDVEVERDHAIGTALLFNIPVATIPQAGEHFGKSKIHIVANPAD